MSATVLACSPIVPLPVSLLTERDLCVYTRSYKHLAPLERKRISLLQFQLESTVIPFTELLVKST